MLIVNGTVFTLGSENRKIENGAIRIQGSVITDTGTSNDLKSRFPGDDIFDAGGRLVLPANICGHTHFYGAFARGMAIPGDAPRDFPEILEKLWWRLDRALLDDGVRFSALVSLMDAIKHGTTTLIDHHASPTALAGSLDTIADAITQAGVRTSLCYEVTDRNGPDEARAGIEENLRFINRVKSGPDPMLGASFGLHASLTLSDETLKICADAGHSAGSGFHIHAAEGIADQEDSLKKYGKRVIHRLRDQGITGPKSIFAHCIHVDPWEMEILRDTGTWVTHQPRSNMNNAVGVAPVEIMLEGGVNVAMGNDGFSNNMWAEWKTAYLVHKLHSGDPRKGDGYAVLKMAVENNAKLCRIFWPETTLGELTPGSAADLMLVDYHPFTDLTPGNLPWHIIFGFEADAVTDTMAAGKWLMNNRKLLTLDEKTITAEARKCAAETWERYLL